MGWGERKGRGRVVEGIRDGWWERGGLEGWEMCHQ